MLINSIKKLAVIKIDFEDNHDMEEEYYGLIYNSFRNLARLSLVTIDKMLINKKKTPSFYAKKSAFILNTLYFIIYYKDKFVGKKCTIKILTKRTDFNKTMYKVKQVDELIRKMQLYIKSININLNIVFETNEMISMM